MGWVKKDLREGVGLSARAGHHSDPHFQPEVRIVLKEYSHHELHKHRPGRSIDDGDIDDFQRGCERLAKGKLRRWVTETAGGRRRTKTTADVVDEDSGSDDNNEAAGTSVGRINPTLEFQGL